MEMDHTKPDTSIPVPVHNVSSPTSTSAPSTSTVHGSQSKMSEDFVTPGPSKRAPAVAPHTALDSMDTSENLQVPSSKGFDKDAFMRLLLSNMDVNSSKQTEDFGSSGPPKRTPNVASSTPLDDTQVPSPMDSEASDENIKLPNMSSSHTQPYPWDIDDQDMSKLFTVLCGEEPAQKNITSQHIADYRWIIWALSHKGGGPAGSMKDVIGHIECLVGLLKSNGNPTLNNFYEVGQRLEGWPKASTVEKHLEYANDIFWLFIGLPKGMPRATHLKNASIQLFDQPLGGDISPFSVTIKQIKDADITIKPTSHFHEHFLYKSGVLYLAELDERRAFSLNGLSGNVIAKEVGIESLGQEILASYNSLLSEDPTWEEAIKIGLLNGCKKDHHRIMVSSLIHVQNQEFSRPFLLARRERDLIKEIERRKKWWRMLLRDIRRQYNTQPFLFYGSVLALLFGVCQIIQTVESLQSIFAPQTPQCGCPGGA